MPSKKKLPFDQIPSKPQMVQPVGGWDVLGAIDQMLGNVPSSLLQRINPMQYPQGMQKGIESLASGLEKGAEWGTMLDKPRQAVWDVMSGGKAKNASDIRGNKEVFGPTGDIASDIFLEGVLDPLNLVAAGAMLPLKGAARGMKWASKLLRQAEKLPNKGSADEFVRLLDNWAAKGAFKGEELQWNQGVEKLRELGNKPMTRNDALQILEEGGLKVVDASRDSWGHLPSLQLPGGKNYGETLITAPGMGFDNNVANMVATEAELAERSRKLGIKEKYRQLSNDYGENMADWPWEDRQEFNKLQEQGWKFDEAKREYAEEIRKAKEIAQKEGKVFKSRHYDAPFDPHNLLTHIRHNDRVGPNGEKILHIEEIQSDWHQKGRTEGYRKQGGPKGELPDGWKIEEVQKGEDVSGGWEPEVTEPYNTKEQLKYNYKVLDEKGNVVSTANDRADAVRDSWYAYNSKGAPDAPFKNDWPDLAAKRMLGKAIDEGYDAISWTTSEQQLKRNSFLHQGITRIEYNPKSNSLLAWQKGDDATPAVQKVVPVEKLHEYIGKDTANKLLSTEPTTDYLGPTNVYNHVLEGENLNITTGGKLHKDLYDTRIPQAFKKMGLKVEKVDLYTPPQELEENLAYFLKQKENLQTKLQAYTDRYNDGEVGLTQLDMMKSLYKDDILDLDRQIQNATKQLESNKDPLASYSTQYVVRLPKPGDSNIDPRFAKILQEGPEMFGVAPFATLLGNEALKDRSKGNKK